MTIKEFWKLKIGTIIKSEYHDFIGKVIKREVYDETSGMIITKSKTIDIKTGRKLLEIWVDIRDPRIKYREEPSRNYLRLLHSDRPDVIKSLTALREDEATRLLNERDDKTKDNVIGYINGYTIVEYSKKTCNLFGLEFPSFAAFYASVPQYNPSFEECSYSNLQDLGDWCYKN